VQPGIYVEIHPFLLTILDTVVWIVKILFILLAWDVVAHGVKGMRVLLLKQSMN
jgi:succinate dehydrogenase/fumarate reductase cytochrome b subunit